MDSPSTDRAKSAGITAGEEVSEILDTISRTSARTIGELKATLKLRCLHRAVDLLGAAGAICIIGPGDAFPVAALLANGLNERGRACEIFGACGAAAEYGISLLGLDDLLILTKLSDDELPGNILAAARACKVPILAIAEADVCAEAGCRDVRLPVPGTRVFGMPALAGHMAVAQLLLIALDQPRAASDGLC